MLNKPRGQAQSYFKYCRMRKQTNKDSKAKNKRGKEEQRIVINISTVNSQAYKITWHILTMMNLQLFIIIT